MLLTEVVALEKMLSVTIILDNFFVLNPCCFRMQECQKNDSVYSIENLTVIIWILDKSFVLDPCLEYRMMIELVFIPLR